MSPFEKWLLLGSTAAVTLTGVVYGWMKYLLTPVEPWAVINHPLQPFMLKLHILVAPFAVFALGMIALRHVWAHFRRGVPARRRSGLLGMSSAIPMILTGYLIQSVTHVGWLAAFVWAHVITGTAYAVALLIHSAIRRPARR